MRGTSRNGLDTKIVRQHFKGRLRTSLRTRIKGTSVLAQRRLLVRPIVIDLAAV